MTDKYALTRPPNECRSKYYIHFWCFMCTFWNIKKKPAKYNYASSKSPLYWSGKTVSRQLSKQRCYISTATDIFSGFCIFYEGFNTTPGVPESWIKKFHQLSQTGLDLFANSNLPSYSCLALIKAWNPNASSVYGVILIAQQHAVKLDGAEPSKGKCICCSWSGRLLAHFHKHGLVDLQRLRASLERGFSLGQ